MKQVTVVAVDLGATSGRVMLGRVGVGVGENVSDRLDLLEVHRFENGPVPLPRRDEGGDAVALHWDAVGLFREVLTGLMKVGAHLTEGEHVAGIGIDTWAVDYGLLDVRGELLGMPYSYRDSRTANAVPSAHRRIAAADLYARNGLQFLPFNTLYQLVAEQQSPRWAAADTMLLLPDLLGYWLTGQAGAEVTNASTTGLLDPHRREWDADLCTTLDIPTHLLPPLRRPGDVVGTLLPHVAEATGLPPSTPVIAVGSHDTASAVAAVPATGRDFAYISSGTWSLVGVELPEPVLTPESQAANFTNEGGVDGRIRYLRNVTGLWLLSESLRVWRTRDPDVDLTGLLAAAEDVSPGGPVIDPDDAAFLPPGDMPGRIEAACRSSGQRPPEGRAAVVRCIVDSLAAAYARAVQDAVRLSGHEVGVLHVVGGGSRNTLLCRLTSAATGLPVLAGPVEATALGNVLVQARALGAVRGDLEALRGVVRRTQPLTRFAPDDAHVGGNLA
jgi:rhamnulokinase